MDCISALWNLVIESASSDSGELSAELRNILVSYVSPLLQCIPATGKRLLLPGWIPKDKLNQGAADTDGENNPPAAVIPKCRGKQLKKSRSPRDQPKSGLTPSKAVGADSDGEDIPLTEFIKRLRSESSSQLIFSSQASGEGIVEATETPPKPKFGSFLQSRRRGTASAPRAGLRGQRSLQKSSESRASVSGRRRLSLVPRKSFEEKVAPQTPIKRSGTSLDSSVHEEDNPPDSTPSKAADIAHADGHVKRCLFGGEPPVAATSLSVEPPAVASPAARKRRLSESDVSPASAVNTALNLPDFEDSAQFVFIPPTTVPNKKIRLTDHQRERRQEQRQAYLPSMYNELDMSQQSTNDFHSDSQSSQDSTFSQSFARFSLPPSTSSFNEKPNSSVAQHEVAKAVSVDRTTDDEVIMAVEAPAPVPLSAASEADDTTRSDSPPVLCSTVRFGSEAMQSPLAATDLLPTARTSSNQNLQPKSRVVLEPFEPTQESQVEQVDPVVIAESAGFSQTQEPDSPVESNTEADKELETVIGTGTRLMEPADNFIVNLTPSISTDLTLKSPTQPTSPSSAQKKMGDVTPIGVSGIDFTSPTPSLTNRMPLNAIRMTSLSPQMSSSNSSRPSASTFLTGSPMISPADVSAPGLNSPLFRGGVGSRAQKMLALGLKKVAELSKQRASQSSVDSQSSSYDEASIDRRSPLSSLPSINVDIAEAGILRDLTTPRSRNRVSFVEHPTVHLLISPPSTVSSETSSPKKMSPTETEHFPGQKGATKAPQAAAELKISQSQDSQEVSFSPVVPTTCLSSSAPTEPSTATSSLEPSTDVPLCQPVSPNALAAPTLSPAAGRRRKMTPPARHPPLNRSSREALRESLQRSPVGTVSRLTKQNRRIRLFAQTSDDEEEEADEEGEEDKNMETETSPDLLTKPSEGRRLANSEQSTQVASSPPVVALKPPLGSFVSKPLSELTTSVEPNDRDEVMIAETQELSSTICSEGLSVGYAQKNAEDEVDVIESSQEQEANELASILAPFGDQHQSDLDTVAKGFSAIPAFIVDTEAVETEEERHIETKKTSPLKDSCLAASAAVIMETEPLCTPTQEGEEDAATTSIMMNSTLTEEVSSLRPSSCELPVPSSPPAPAQEEAEQEIPLSRVRISLQNLANDLPLLPREVHKDILFEALAALKSIM
ncbi:unnamed protein product [Schistocephalus solidus]|uniref:Uncharacterized protein n=1 Tax=Schistocephalus solidus TaxID=70667 RepID=A0A3P7EIA1_SCHSO|nr:unnamed protein product [Schistocephalus solidus]